MLPKTVARALELRNTLLSRDAEQIVVVDFTDTLQGKDTSRVIDLMPNVNTNEYVFRAKVNVKEIDPLASKEYKTDFFDVRTMPDSEIEAVVRKSEFDFPLWYKHSKGFEMSKIMDYNLPFILQVAGCNFYNSEGIGGCRYCFVDDISNNGKPGKGKAKLTIEDTVESFKSARDKIKEQYKANGFDVSVKVLRASGGEPAIALDWILNLVRAVNSSSLFQIDTNLSTGPAIEHLEKEGQYERNILQKLAEYDVKFLAAIKGVDGINIQNNVNAEATMAVQLYSIKKLVRSGLDVYFQAYNPNPETLEAYLAEMDMTIENFSLRFHIGPLKIYGPNIKRLEKEAEKKGLDKKQFVESAKKQWDSNYKQGCEVLDSYLRKRYNVGYKQITRSDAILAVS
jgi:uncharacterized Fe-S cluster-containing radical SAM superfamily protein